MRRREFIALLGSAAAIPPLGARAERPRERILYFTYSAGYRHDVIPFLGNSLQVEDEIYQISDFDYRGSRVLLRLDQSSVDLSKTGGHQRFYGWPLAWKRSYGEGRVSYTALGHEASVWRDARYQQILTNAILWSTRRSL